MLGSGRTNGLAILPVSGWGADVFLLMVMAWHATVVRMLNKSSRGLANGKLMVATSDSMQQLCYCSQYWKPMVVGLFICKGLLL